MARAEANVKKMSVKAPMDGIVVMQSIVRNGEFGQIREGDQVAAGQPFVQIVDPSSMVLNATVNQVDAEKLRLGMKATIHMDAYPDIELPGTLMGIGAMAKTSTFRARYVGEIPVRIKLEKTDPRVIPDLTGSAEIVLNSERNTMVAPRSAVFAEESGSYVFVQGPEGWIKKKVELGLPSFTRSRSAPEFKKGMSSRCSVRCRSRVRPTGIQNTWHRRIKDPASGWANRTRGRVKIITWTIGPGVVRRRRCRGVPLHGHHGSGSAGGARAPRRFHHQRADARRYQERPLHHPEGAAGARSAHRPPGAERAVP